MTADAKSDHELLHRAGRGDQEAFRAVVHRHLPRILRIAERIVGDPGYAEDIAQSVMVKLWKTAPYWDGAGARVDTWLYRVTVNAAIDEIRRKKPVFMAEPPEQIDDAPGAIDLLHRRQLRDQVRELLTRLTDQQRIALVLAYFEEMTTQEIAHILDTTPGAVAALLHRGRQSLKLIMVEVGIQGWDDDGQE